MPPAATKSEKAFLSMKVNLVKATKSLTLVSFEKESLVHGVWMSKYSLHILQFKLYTEC